MKINWVYEEDHPDYYLINEAWLRIYKIDLLTEKIPWKQFAYNTSILANDNILKPKTKFGETYAILNYNNEYIKYDKNLHNEIIKLKNILSNERKINLVNEFQEKMAKQLEKEFEMELKNG